MARKALNSKHSEKNSHSLKLVERTAFMIDHWLIKLKLDENVVLFLEKRDHASNLRMLFLLKKKILFPVDNTWPYYHMTNIFPLFLLLLTKITEGARWCCYDCCEPGMLPKNEFDLLLKCFSKMPIMCFFRHTDEKKHREIIGTRPFYNLVPIASLFLLFGYFAEIPKLELGRKAQATIWQVGRSVHWLVHKKAAAERFDCGQVPPNQPRKFQTFDEITVQTKHNCFRFPDTYLFRLTDSWTECIQ